MDPSAWLRADADEESMTWGRWPAERIARLEGQPLHELTIEEACAVRWMSGRRARGMPLDAPFAGEPLAEAFEEAIDLVSYLRVDGLTSMAAEAYDFARRIRELLRSRRSR